MTDLPLVQDDQSFEDLGGNLLGVDLRLILRNVCAEMAMLDVLHREVDRVSVEIFEPAKESNE